MYSSFWKHSLGFFLFFLIGATLLIKERAVYLAPNNISTSCDEQNTLTLPIKWGGAFKKHPVVEDKINGMLTHMLFDTGASQTYLMRSAVEKLGVTISTPASAVAGFGGNVTTSHTNIRSFSVGPFIDDRPDLKALADITFLPEVSAILGGNYLFSTNLEINLRNQYVNFYKSSACVNKFWAQKKVQASTISNIFFTGDDTRPQFTININGKKLRAIIDTGSSASFIDVVVAAEKLGITRRTAGAIDSAIVTGVGANAYRSWSVPIDEIIIGRETIKNARIKIASMEKFFSDGEEVLLGTDFLMHHKFFFSANPNRIYFDYVGGRVLETEAISAIGQ